jgi:hypothetical protein
VRISKAIRSAVGLALAVSACTTHQQEVSQGEDLLAEAGFQVRPADSPGRAAEMKQLPANRFVTKVVAGKPIYFYADPIVCNCVYFGTQQNWDAYRQLVNKGADDSDQEPGSLRYGPMGAGHY